MEILYFDILDSTHLYLIDAIKNATLKPPVAIVANSQPNGIGSGKNSWESYEGNLFLSFALKKESLPSDLPLSSASIYFSLVLKETLVQEGSKVWVKWPNDLYINDKKIAGVITKSLNDETIIGSIGLNLKNSSLKFDILDINIDLYRLLDLYFLKLKQVQNWKNLFSNYKIEFEQSKRFGYFDKKLKKRVSLNGAILNEDGSITINDRKVYSLR